MKKAIKITISSVVGVVILVLVWIAFCGFQWSWGPFCKLHDIKTGSYPGNAEEYAIKNVTPLENSPLKGKEVFSLVPPLLMALLLRVSLLRIILEQEMSAIPSKKRSAERPWLIRALVPMFLA